jgi:hypothetical protein
MARPKEKQLRTELDAALTELHDAPNEGNVAASVAHATAMIRVWSLRFQLAQYAYDKAVQTGDGELAPRNAMREASVQLNEWEKRKGAAITDLVNDLLLSEQQHTEEQTRLANEAQQLSARKA